MKNVSFWYDGEIELDDDDGEPERDGLYGSEKDYICCFYWFNQPRDRHARKALDDFLEDDTSGMLMRWRDVPASEACFLEVSGK